MVHLVRPGPDLENDEQGLRLNKRSKLSTPDNEFGIKCSQYNPLDEPSPLGLRLRKSPSLLDLIQMRLSQNNATTSTSSVTTVAPKSRDKKGLKGNTSSAATEKLKATNFPATLLKIGDWEFVSRFDGDLVAKCYFAKHKLVWEILQNGLKSKIEIQWPDIISLSAKVPDDGPGTLSIMLSRPPHFFKETNPQPRKHTLWQTSADFTDGQASIYRQHVLQCRQDVLNKHYEKLIQCDMHLSLVSKQPAEIESPYFDEQASFLKNPAHSIAQGVNKFDTLKSSPISSLQDVQSPSSSFNIEEQSSIGLTPEHVSLEAPSPSSVMDLRGSEGNSSQGEDGSQAQENWEQLNALGIHKSMSMSDIVNHIGHCISERMASENSSCSKTDVNRHMLENIAQVLLNDTHLPTAADEKKLMARVNSLCCLLQDPGVGPNSQSEIQFEGAVESEKLPMGISKKDSFSNLLQPMGMSKKDDLLQPMGMSRKDSFSDLLLSLPRITSLPKFLFDISEVDENQAK